MPEMVLADDPYLIDGPQMSAAEMRRQLSGLLAHDAHPIAARAGVLQGMGLTVNSTTRVATLGAGTAVVTPVVGSAGSYVVSSATSASAVTLDVRDATNPRIDLVVLRVYDETNRKQAVLEAVTGTPAASPSVPTAPTGALVLHAVTVPPGSGTITVSDRRTFTSTTGGVIRCTEATRPSGSSLPPGQPIFETDTRRGWTWDGSMWLLTSAPATGLAGESPLLSTEATWSTGNLDRVGYVGAGGMAEISLGMLTNVAKVPSSTGNLGALHVGTLKPNWVPRNNYFGTFQYRNTATGGGFLGGAMAIYRSSGEIRLLNIAAGTEIGTGTADVWSIRLTAQYYPASIY